MNQDESTILISNINPHAWSLIICHIHGYSPRGRSSHQHHDISCNLIWMTVFKHCLYTLFCHMCTLVASSYLHHRVSVSPPKVTHIYALYINRNFGCQMNEYIIGHTYCTVLCTTYILTYECSLMDKEDASLCNLINAGSWET